MTEQELEETLKVINSNDPWYGTLPELKYDILKYNQEQLISVSKGRGHIFGYGNIDDLDPEMYDECQMFWVSLGRGASSDYGNIDDLDPNKVNADQMSRISRDREYNLHLSIPLSDWGK